MRNPIFRRFALVYAVIIGLSACGGSGGGGGSSSSPATGTLKVGLVDAPACGYDHVYVTVQKVRVNQSSTAADSDPGWVEIVNPAMARVDLLSLNNGVLSDLGQTGLAAGHYTQLELVLAANGSSAPFANSLVLSSNPGAEIALTTPSAQQSGLKINADITVTANQEVDFLVDFNACKSIVSAGNSGKYLLKPVLTVTPVYLSGIDGYVDPAVAATTIVSAQQGGRQIQATVPDATGKFTLVPLLPGNYDLVIAASGRATEVLTAVPVATALLTPVNTIATPYLPPLSANAVVTGTVTVTPTVTPLLADVQVEQTFASGTQIDLLDRPVDATFGTFSDSLPLAAPLIATYVALPAPAPAFGADGTAAGKYTLSATYGLVTKTSATVTLSAANTPPAPALQLPPFTFP
ncbi:MAG: DUF4382 domain-containing protein [Pseudomonadota bacterium]|nr:DUF4382 domain-containing protein [Pseudomonadota bacterium]